jgi:cytochrome P450
LTCGSGGYHTTSSPGCGGRRRSRGFPTRGRVSGAFSQRAVAVYEHFIAELTEQVLDECPASEPFDFVDAVAKQVPIRVLAWIMGLPAADLDLFIDLRVSRFELTGEPRRIRSNFTNGLKTLPVRVFP